MFFFSVCAKLHACEPGYDLMSSFFICILYKSFKGTTDDYELGFLQSSLLVKICHMEWLFLCLANPIQVYKHIFTSPTSAKDGSITLSDVENDLPAPQSCKIMKSKKAIHKDVTSSLQMNGKVSSHSIAYAVIQVLHSFLIGWSFLLMELISFSSTCGTPLLGAQPMLDSISMPAIALSLISLIPLVVQMRRNVLGNSWSGGIC